MSNKLKYLAFELVYLIIMTIYFVYLKLTYSINASLELPIFIIVLSILYIFIILFKANINRYIVFIYSFLYSLYLVSQSIYFRAFNQYFRFETAINLYSEAMGVKDSVLAFIRFNDLIPFILLLLITILFIYLYYKYQRFFDKPNILYNLSAIVFIVPILISIYKYNYQVNKLDENTNIINLNQTDYYIYKEIPSTNQFVSKFGLLTFFYKDINSLFINEDIDINRIDKYLNNQDEHIDNDMTAYFKDKNLIIIQAESFNDIVVDKDLTPTIYKLKNEGLQVTGFNNPTLSASTSDTEFMANLSLIPSVGGACYKYGENTYDITLAKAFKENGYKTYAFHNNYGNYYNRNVTYPNMGYDYFYDCIRLGIEDTSDDYIVTSLIEWALIEEDEPYLAYFITYNGHQPYTLDSTGVYVEDIKKIKEKYPNLSDEYVSYFAKNMNLDKAINELITNLEISGKLEDAVIMFFGDHSAKELNFNEDSSIYKEMNITFKEEYTYTDLYFYSIDKEPLIYNKVATSLDLLPTIANLWDMDIDNKKILGKDIFDSNYEGLYFTDYGYYRSDNFIYDELNEELILFNNISKDEAMNYINDFKEKRSISNDILASDYYK